jgi:hypothetical protein
VVVTDNEIANMVSDPDASTVGVGVGVEASGASEVEFTSNTITNAEFLLEDKTATVDLNNFANTNTLDRGALLEGAAFNPDRNVIFNSIADAETFAEQGDRIEVIAGSYDESVTIDVDGLTIEGPNAGIAGDSNQRGEEATITDANGRSEINAANVTIDGLNFEFGEQAIRSGGGVDGLITNSRFELTANTSDGYAIRAEESSTGIDVTDNLFTGITSNDGTGGATMRTE